MNMKMIKRIAALLLFASLVIPVAGCMPVFAEAVDQTVGVSGFTEGYPLTPEKTCGQTFIPAADNIIGVDLVVTAEKPVRETLTVTIRESSGNVPEDFTGRVVISTTQTVKVPRSDEFPYGTVHVGFPYAAQIVPGATYVLEVKASESDGSVGWIYTNDKYENGLLVLDRGSGPSEYPILDWCCSTWYRECRTPGYKR